MKDIELYKWITENEIETDWRGDELVIWIPFDCIRSFVKLVGPGHFAQSGLSVELQEYQIAFDIVPICEFHGIDPQIILATT